MFAGMLQAQYQLEGRILDASDDTPLEHSTVYFPQLENGVVTDANGFFQIRQLPEGTYKLVVSMIGYASYTRSITLGEASPSLTIKLQPSAIEMEEVIVSTPFHKLQRENVMKVEQAPMAEIRKNGAPTLAEGLRQIAGVESVTTGAGIGKPVIRGLSSNRVLVYTQGIRMENQQFGSEHGLGISDAGIESVEVIKGPASLLYGSDALGGVLYLNPERFAQAGSTKADATVQYLGNTSGIAANAGAGVSGEQWKFLARLARASHADYQDGEGTRVTNSRFSEWDLKTGVGFTSGRFKNDLRYNYNRSEPGIPEEIGVQGTDRDPLLPYQEIESHILSNTTELFMKNSSFKVILGYVGNSRLEFEDHEEHAGEEDGEEHAEEEHGEEGPALDMQLNTLNYNLQYQFSSEGDRWQTVVGVQGMWQDNSNAGEEVLIPDARTVDVGLMATSHIHFTKSDLQLGLRYDRRQIDSDAFGTMGESEYIAPLDRSFNSFNAAAGYRVDFVPGLIGRLNLASGFRAPNLSELGSNGTHSGANRFEIGNPDLENERNVQVDLSLEYKGEHFELGVNGFHNQIRDYIFIAPTGNVVDGDPEYQYEQQDATLYGGEAVLHLHPHPLDWLHLQSNLAVVVGELDSGTPLPLIPPVNWRNTLRVEWDKIGKTVTDFYSFLGLESYFRQGQPGDFETETPAYNLLHAGFGARVPLFGNPIEIRVAANNLLDTTFVSHLSRLKADGINNMGRNISVGMTMMF